MKRKELIKKLKAKGAKQIRQGGNHEIWINRNGNSFTVPRHTEIKEQMAKIILKQAGR